MWGPEVLVARALATKTLRSRLYRRSIPQSPCPATWPGSMCWCVCILYTCVYMHTCIHSRIHIYICMYVYAYMYMSQASKGFQNVPSQSMSTATGSTVETVRYMSKELQSQCNMLGLYIYIDTRIYIYKFKSQIHIHTNMHIFIYIYINTHV